MAPLLDEASKIRPRGVLNAELNHQIDTKSSASSLKDSKIYLVPQELGYGGLEPACVAGTG